MDNLRNVLFFKTKVKFKVPLDSYVILMFHWSRPVGNYVIFESRDQCLQCLLGLVVVSTGFNVCVTLSQ